MEAQEEARTTLPPSEALRVIYGLEVQEDGLILLTYSRKINERTDAKTP